MVSPHILEKSAATLFAKTFLTTTRASSIPAQGPLRSNLIASTRPDSWSSSRRPSSSMTRSLRLLSSSARFSIEERCSFTRAMAASSICQPKPTLPAWLKSAYVPFARAISARWAREAFVTMVGPSVVMAQPLFDAGVDMAAGSIVMDPDLARHAVKSGGGMPFGSALQMAAITK